MEQAILAAIVLSLTEVIKRATKLEKRYVPSLAVILGVVLSFVGTYFGVISVPLISGTVAGLMACGLWDLGKKTILGR